MDIIKQLDQLDNKIVEIRIHFRNKHKYLTTIENLPINNIKKIVKKMKKKFCCNGNICDGNVIQLQGDQRENCRNYLVNKKICLLENMRIHGY